MHQNNVGGEPDLAHFRKKVTIQSSVGTDRKRGAPCPQSRKARPGDRGRGRRSPERLEAWGQGAQCRGEIHPSLLMNSSKTVRPMDNTQALQRVGD